MVKPARPIRLASALLIPALWFAEPRIAAALQVVEATDGVTVEAVLAIKEPTRIRIDGASITNVFGNIYSSNCGAAVSTQPGTAAALEVADLWNYIYARIDKPVGRATLGTGVYQKRAFGRRTPTPSIAVAG